MPSPAATATTPHSGCDREAVAPSPRAARCAAPAARACPRRRSARPRRPLEERDRPVGIVGVHVNAQRRAVADDQHRVADLLDAGTYERSARGRRRRRRSSCSSGTSLSSCWGRASERRRRGARPRAALRLSAQRGEDARDQQRDPVAAGVHDAHARAARAAARGRARPTPARPSSACSSDLGEHCVLLLVGRVGAEARLAHVRELGRDAVRHLAHDRDHRALGGIAHGASRRRRRRGRARATRAPGRPARRAGSRALRPAPRTTWERITPLLPRAPSSAARATVVDDLVAADIVEDLPLQAVELVDHGAQRLHHVVAGVAVRDREHVEVVDLLAARLEQRAGARRHDLAEALLWKDRPRGGPWQRLGGLGHLPGLQAARADIHAPGRAVGRRSAPSEGWG